MIRPTDVDALLDQSERAFVRELPILLRDHAGEWVAYHGVDRVGQARTKAEVYAKCHNLGLSGEEFLVRCIEPQADEVIIGPDAAKCER